MINQEKRLRRDTKALGSIINEVKDEDITLSSGDKLIPVNGKLAMSVLNFVDVTHRISLTEARL
jgi:hypothetical protein